MYRDEDPLDAWLWLASSEPDEHDRARSVRTSRELKELAAFLRKPVKPDAPASRRQCPAPSLRGVLSDSDRALAQELYRKVFERGGPGCHDAQRSLLEALGASAPGGSAAFFREVVDFTCPRDKFSRTRRLYATAALGLLVARHDDDDARQGLVELTAHAEPEVRALAVTRLDAGYAHRGNELPAPIKATFERIAVEEKEQAPRLMAWRALRDRDLRPANAAPVGALDFEVRLVHGPKASRTLRVKSTQALDELHYAVQDAFEWDADHLYSFFLDADRLDPSTRIDAPEAEEDEAVLAASEVEVGSLGLAKGDRILYLFDYGDEHVFTLTVVEVHAKAPAGKLPAVLKTVGKAPRQYRNDDW